MRRLDLEYIRYANDPLVRSTHWCWKGTRDLKSLPSVEALPLDTKVGIACRGIASLVLFIPSAAAGIVDLGVRLGLRRLRGGVEPLVLADEILPGLFLGNILSAEKESVEALGVKRILSLGVSIQTELPHLFIPVSDRLDSDLKSHFQQCIDFIKEGLGKGEKVLVHCKGGQERSPTIVVAYLMSEHNCTFSEAEALVVSRHPASKIHAGFKRQLKNR